MRLSSPIFQLKRRAKLLARDHELSLHEALDRVAQDEGFARWSLLASRWANTSASRSVLSRLSDGDMLLLGARPGHGKTLLGLEMLLDAAADGRRAVLFTLESYEREARERISALNQKNHGIAEKLEIVTSDDICADYILQYLAGSPCKAVAVIDYLQLLDQKRSKPALADQMLVLQSLLVGARLSWYSSRKLIASSSRRAIPCLAFRIFGFPTR